MYTRKLKGLDKLNELNIPKDQAVIYGSAPMVLRGLKEKNNDLDVLISENLWNKLSIKYPSNVKGEYIDIDSVSFAYTDKNFLGDMNEVIKETDVIDGYRVLGLEATRSWKQKVGGEKHLQDVKVIDEYLNRLEKKL